MNQSCSITNILVTNNSLLLTNVKRMKILEARNEHRDSGLHYKSMSARRSASIGHKLVTVCEKVSSMIPCYDA